MVVHHFQKQIDVYVQSNEDPEVKFYYWMEQAPSATGVTLTVRRIILKNIDRELYTKEFVMMSGNMPVFK